MKKIGFFLILLLVVFFLLALDEPGNQIRSHLWPEIQPYQSGYLRVSDIHRIYYEVSGNPAGKPLFFLHGGPGDSSSPQMRRLANPGKFMIVLHDQRGAGQSLPLNEIRENTTQNLVADIERLRQHLGLKEIILVGGSWGTTLALTYAQTYPQNVAGMVLRGVFTATKSEIDHIFNGGVALLFPEAYQHFLDALPDPDARPLPSYIFQLLRNGDKKTKLNIARAWGRFTLKISSLDMSEESVNKILNSWNPYSNAYLENYYVSHDAFLEEGQLLRNATIIAHIPAVIVQGRYDFICPMNTAYKLHQALPKSKLVVVEGAGHSSLEPSVQKALCQAIAFFEN